MANVAVSVVIQAAKNTTTKVASTTLGMAVSYGSLVIMAILPIYFGSYRSISHPRKKERETLTTKRAAMLPIIASCVLFSLYIKFKRFPTEHTDLPLTEYFSFLGVLALTQVLSPIVGILAPTKSVLNIRYHILFTKMEDNRLQNIINYKFSSYEVVSLACSVMVGAWYLLQKHWVANNLFGLAFSINAVEQLHLNNIVAGCMLLSGLFIYDIFWVFGTDVMATVANSFEAPIKLVFPQNLLTNGRVVSNFAMLGLGDIILPGIFIALLLRFDHSLKRQSNFYFHATLLAYFLGLMVTIFVAHVFKHGQPALLYLVPACLGTPLVLALAKGDLKALFKYEDNQNLKKEKKNGEKQENAIEIKKVD